MSAAQRTAAAAAASTSSCFVALAQLTTFSVAGGGGGGVRRAMHAGAVYRMVSPTLAELVPSTIRRLVSPSSSSSSSTSVTSSLRTSGLLLGRATAAAAAGGGGTTSTTSTSVSPLLLMRGHGIGGLRAFHSSAACWDDENNNNNNNNNDNKNGNGNGDSKRKKKRRGAPPRNSSGGEEEGEGSTIASNAAEADSESGSLTEVDLKGHSIGGHVNTDSGLSTKQVPEVFPEVLVLPIDRTPVFPKFIKIVEIKDKALIARVKHNIQLGIPYAGAFLKKDDKHDGDVVKALSEIHQVGTFVHIQETADVPSEGKLRMLLMGHRRILATEAVPDSEFLTVKVDNVVDEEYEKSNPTVKALAGEIIKTVRDIIKLNPLYRETIHQILEMNHKILQDASHLADFGAVFTSAEPALLQGILQERNVEQRLSKCLDLLKQEHLQAKLQTQIRAEVEEKINNMRRQHLLEEQLKIIKRELGHTKDDKETVIGKFKARIKDAKMSDAVKLVIDEELSKLQFLDANSSEFNVSRNYLDWLTLMPWGKLSTESLDIANAQKILDEDHFGLKDVKDRILEFIAVGSLVGTVQGKILCFVGPPGVGKTSIGKSIARALNRQYFRFSVGGLHDVAEIKGHRRTYVGAMPGKMVQALKKVGCENPLVLIDEIDKIGRGGHQGDPTSALLELLDPEQNPNFLDHYLDVPIDMSKVLFICTANVTDTIPGPLLDRMEVIDISGYMAEEKVSIAQTYLIPAAIKNAGLTGKAVSVTDGAIQKLIRMYCRESGVRNLQKHIEKIFRKAALGLVRDNKSEIAITEDNLHEYVGNPRWTSDRLYDVTPPGIVMGLAWTAMGGSVLYIETVATQTRTKDKDSHSERGFHITGSLGDVMKESAKIALTYAKHAVWELHPDNTFFGTADISLHVPEGATPKDGPSAGVTIVTALLSLALNKPVRSNLAMTGEVSLTGKVLKVGGIREKMLAAKRAGVTTVVLPALNRSDFEELPDFVKKDLEVHFAENYQDVYKVAFS